MNKIQLLILTILASFTIACGSEDPILAGGNKPDIPQDTVPEKPIEDAELSILFEDCSGDTLVVNPHSLPTLSVVVRAKGELSAVNFFKVNTDEKKSTTLLKQVASFDSLHVYRCDFTAAQLGLDYQTVAALRVTVEDVEDNYLQRQLEFEYVDPSSLAPQIRFTNATGDTLKVNSDPNADKPTPCFAIASDYLDSVRLYILKKSGTAAVATQHGSSVTTFNIGEDYSACFEDVTYTDDMVGLRVYATTRAGKSAMLDLPLKVALDPNAAPSIKFLTGSTLRINTHARATKPYAQFRVTSTAGLKKLKIWRVNYDSDYELVEIATFTAANKRDFTYEVKELTSNYFTGLESVYVEAFDEADRYSKAILPVEKYSADPLIDDLSAFPGAEGFGRNVTGGRGGAVYYVTSLSDGNTVGTLRHAVNQTGARTIVFKVSGTIYLQSRLNIANGNLTIAGQTAPGDGICLAGYDVIVAADNVIVRYIRCRMGDINNVESDALWSRGRNNVIVDHCSMSWSVDECGSFYEMQNFTLQWCLLSESLRNSKHDKGMHGYGGIWGGQNATFHHNILAHHDSRNPRFASGESGPEPIDYRNNVVYNWGGNSGYGGEASNINIVNNYNKPGPVTKSGAISYKIYSPDKKTQDDGSHRFDGTGGKPSIIGVFGRFYVSGNYLYGSPEATANNWDLGIQVPSGYGATAQDKANMKATVPFAFEPITQHSAEVAYERVLEAAGASLKRDKVDARVINEVRTGTYTYTGSNGSTKGLIDCQDDVGGWPALESWPAPLDTDADGMPDAWEVLNGLNPNDASDRNTKTLSSVYTNLEVYLSSIVVEITDRQRKQ